jgi:hypothetical protein
MPIQHAIWKVGDNPLPLSRARLASEQKLEEMIVRDSRIFSNEWMLIGRQEVMSYGGRIDLLAIAADGSPVLGDETLRAIARDLVETVRNNVIIDWTPRGNFRAQLRVLVKRILRKHGYPPDKQEKATQTVLQQAELLCADWAEAG